MSDKKTVVDMLVKKFGGTVSEYAGEENVVIPVAFIMDAARALHADFSFELLSDVTAVDYWPQEKPRFHVVYRFTSIANNQTLNVRVPLDASSAVIASLESIYRSANWYEREVFDMFGIKFEGNSDLRRIIMPFDWEGHPLRKDYPLGYEEPQYSFNFEEINARKPYAKE